MRIACTAALFFCSSLAWSQSEADLADGKATFRSNCAFCHGLTGGGGRGPTLNSGRLLHGSTEQDIKNVVTNGVPGTSMPAFEFEKDELTRLVAYIRTLAESSAKSAPVTGDPVQGRKVYERSGCPACHRIGMEGSIYGPELTRVGAGRSSEYIRESIVNPSADIPQEYGGVTVVTRDGNRITGVRINEDTFTVQMRDPSQNFQMFRKDEVQQVIPETKSLMPAYSSLDKDDLQNLLAYLDTLRGDLHAGAGVTKAEGIR
ncbi:MAG TPA: c-type cytochrome [Bryobacteraceae bacterium]|nr:c-type cytochrome [Bryobacteraceae bacterium]